MRRFFLDPARWTDPRPALDPGESHHAADVIRVGPGDRITVFDGRGREAMATVADVAKACVRLQLGPENRSAALPCSITLGQAIPKGKSFEVIVQKAVELGAARIVPILSERSVVRLDREDGPRKRDKWREIALEACKQCGQNTLPEILEPATPQAFLSAPPAAELLLIASLQPDARHIKTVLADFAGENRRTPSSVAILIGPEGDFTPAEVALAKSSGYLPVTLGPIILRSETAAVYCLSVLSHELFAP